MSSFTDTTTVVAVDDTLSTTLDGESVILHPSTGTYYGFNSVGSEIWESIHEPQSISDLTQQIAEQYDVPQERCRDDIEDLVAELAEEQLVKVDDS